ncbi:hypothetical protein FBZ98_1215 [Rhizobium sp. ERR 922]|uniref:hypothetical protein n=1 Tax=unclassified Rhizobium TaxID=2613769 RepID=UPI0011ABCA04|nr:MULTISPECIES: hypothetical protein [unclassified Rhizobium]TWB43585.1 hypothetical protein FBZ98_1215 [Rhizobium sp. ERR 922]TWB87392.1 hypothetical protein FBZ97_12013 [Rhizobium sp. ERR 942]
MWQTYPRKLMHHFADGRVSILEAAVTRVPKIITVENVECEIILTKLQIAENKQVLP